MISTKEMRHHIRAPDYSNAWREKSEQIISYAANLIDAAEDLKREVADLTAKLQAAEAKLAESEDRRDAERINELEKRIAQLELARATFGPLPKQHAAKGCLFCGGEHGGLACPKLVATSAAIEAER